MLESAINQASGLAGMASPSAPRMMAMVSHGDTHSELPMLWRLCWALTEFGYALTVLDATTQESAANPGLEHLLDNAFWRAPVAEDGPAWNVIPAACGVQALCEEPGARAHKLAHLGQLFAHESVVILYGKSEWLVPLMADTGTEPLLALSRSKTSLLSSYVALKRLLLQGRLEPNVVNWARTSADANDAATASLTKCAKDFLSYDVNALHIASPTEDDPTSGAIQRLALRLMERAIPLHTPNVAIPLSRPSARLASALAMAGAH
ncbi:MAG: hypothetical protein WCK83_08920 [Burkholderiales bacterium]